MLPAGRVYATLSRLARDGLAIIAATFPLPACITGPETARTGRRSGRRHQLTRIFGYESWPGGGSMMTACTGKWSLGY